MLTVVKPCFSGLMVDMRSQGVAVVVASQASLNGGVFLVSVEIML